MPDETPIPEGSMPNETTALDILQRQVESLITQLEKITGERDEFRARVEDHLHRAGRPPGQGHCSRRPGRPDRRAGGAIRDRRHYDKFAELAKGAKAKDAALKHLWQVSGYKAEADEPDEKALGKLVEDLRKSADYAFEPSDNADFGMRNAESKIQIGNRQGRSTGWRPAPLPSPLAAGGRPSETRAATARSSRLK